MSVTCSLKAFEIQETCYPYNHIIIASALHNIANRYLKKRDYHRSLKYFNDSLNIRKQILPPEHVDLASTLTNVGTLYCKIGRMDEVLTCFTKSLKMYETVFPNGHPNTSICLTNFAHFYQSQGNYDHKHLFISKKHLKLINYFYQLFIVIYQAI
jgi:tetratricopeptide (TPR) repeat protein